jgi:hypothetical protein
MAFGLLLVAALLLESIARALQQLFSLAVSSIAPSPHARDKSEPPGHHGSTLPPSSQRGAVPLGALVRVGALGVCGMAACQLAAVNRPLIESRRRESANPHLVIARAVEAHTRGRDEARGRASDLVLITGVGDYAPTETYIPYFARRNVVTLADALKHHGPGSGRTREDAIAWLRARIRRSWQRGAQVYVLQELLESPAAFRALKRRYGMTQAQAKTLLRDFQLEPAFRVRGAPVYRLSEGWPSLTARAMPAEAAPAGERLSVGLRESGPLEGVVQGYRDHRYTDGYSLAGAAPVRLSARHAGGGWLGYPQLPLGSAGSSGIDRRYRKQRERM